MSDENTALGIAAAPTSPRPYLVGVAVLFVLMIVALIRYQPPPARGLDAPTDTFSSARAMNVLTRLVGVGIPHPVASAEHDAMRDRVLAEFSDLGLEPHLHKTFAGGNWGNTAHVENIAARLPGAGGGSAIMLMAHYDSVAAGPGASDDGAGCAVILEIARILNSRETMRNDVIFLITDAEEAGLLGARGFAADHPWRNDVRVIINLEARGSRGPATMFETGPDNGWLIDLMAAHAERVVSTSLFPTIYEMLPNDTDYSVFKKEIPGLNYGFIAGWPHYHSPRDTIDNIDPNTLQHMGDQVLAMTRALGDHSLVELPKGSAVFFDVFGFHIFRWSKGAAVFYALCGLALVVVSALRQGAREQWEYTRSLLGIPHALLGLVLAGLGGALTVALVKRLTGVDAPWTAQPLPMWGAILAVGLGAPALVFAWAAKRTSPWRVWSGISMCFAITGVLTSLFLPGVSYLFITPAVISGLFALLSVMLGTGPMFASLSLLVTAGCLFLPLVIGARDALDFTGHLAMTLPVALVTGGLLPLFVNANRRAIALSLGALAATYVLGVIGACVVDPYSEEWPVQINVIYHQDADTGAARWLANTDGIPLPESMQNAANFTPERVAPLPMSPKRWFSAYPAPAPWIAMPEPEVTVLGTKKISERSRWIRVGIRSPRGASQVTLALPPEIPVVSASLNGMQLEPLSERTVSFSNKWRVYRCATTPPEGIEIELIVESMETFTAYVMDQTGELPAEAEPITSARPVWSDQRHRGDLWIISRQVTL